MPASKLLSIKKLDKSFGTPVLRKLDFDVRQGEVHALMGSNGAGKSTVCNIIAGIHQPDSGSMRLNGQTYRPTNIKTSEAVGVRMVMQELNLFPTLSIAENISFKSLSRSRAGIINHGWLAEKAKSVLASFHLDHLNPHMLMGKLGVGQQQLIEIASVIAEPVDLLILDEPTAALTDPEIDELFSQINILRQQGTGIIYISHRMDEINRIADRISVLRDGELVATVNSREVDKDEIVSMMAGQRIESIAANSEGRGNQSKGKGTALMRVENLWGDQFQNINFELNSGEILGICGLIGSGRTELLRAVFGADRAHSGGVRLASDQFKSLHQFSSPAKAIEKGIGMIVEDRKSLGLLLPGSISQNISLGSMNRLQNKIGIVKKDLEQQHAAALSRLLEVKFDQLDQPVAELSGGNQQKILIARWLLKDMQILMFDEPSRGVDARAKQLILRLIREQAREVNDTTGKKGKGIIVVSSETRELMEISDRILVMSNGRLAGEFDAKTVTEEELLSASFKFYTRADRPDSLSPLNETNPQ